MDRAFRIWVSIWMIWHSSKMARQTETKTGSPTFPRWEWWVDFQGTSWNKFPARFPGKKKPWQNEDSLCDGSIVWRQHCILRCCPRPWQNTAEFSVERRAVKICVRHKCCVRAKTSEHLGNMITPAMLPPQCVLVLPAPESPSLSRLGSVCFGSCDPRGLFFRSHKSFKKSANISRSHTTLVTRRRWAHSM